MGDGEGRRLYGEVVVEEDVQVDRARAVADGLHPAEVALDPLERGEERGGGGPADPYRRVDLRERPAVVVEPLALQVGQVHGGDVGKPPGARHQDRGREPSINAGEHPSDERPETVADEPDPERLDVRPRKKEVDSPAKVNHRPDMLAHRFPGVRNRPAPGRYPVIGPGGIDQEGDRTHPGKSHGLGEERGPAPGPRVEEEDAGVVRLIGGRGHQIGPDPAVRSGLIRQVADRHIDAGRPGAGRFPCVVVEERAGVLNGSSHDAPFGPAG